MRVRTTKSSIILSAMRGVHSYPALPMSHTNSVRGSVSMGMSGAVLELGLLGVVVASFAKVVSLSGYSVGCCAAAISFFAIAIRC